jgi:hypothetical protein
MAIKLKDKRKKTIVGQREPIPAPEGLVNDESRLHEFMEPGDVTHQGDVTIVRLREFPQGRYATRASRQLADGDTKGSRHVMTRGEVFDCDPAVVAAAINELDERFEVQAKYCGVVFISPENPTADDLTHPEHGNHGFPAGAICAVVHQRNLDSEMRERRALD